MSTSTKTTDLHAFRYAPGNGYVYTWSGAATELDRGEGRDRIHVWRIEQTEPMILADTGDRIDPPAARNAEAFMTVIRVWAGLPA